MLELEKALEDPGQENRARVLGGKDPSPVEMIKKIEQVTKALQVCVDCVCGRTCVCVVFTRVCVSVLIGCGH